MKVVCYSLALGLGGVLAISGLQAANADTETFTTIIPSTAISTTQSYMLQAFNPAMGTLTGVQLTFAPIFAASTGVVNLNAVPTTVTDAKTIETLVANGPSSLSVGPLTLTSDSGPISVVLGPGGSTHIAGAPVSTSGTDSIATGLGAYEIAPLNVTVTVDTTGVSAGGTANLNQVAYFGGGTLSGDLMITYTYNKPVIVTNTPEPGSLAMFAGMGVTGSLFALRRRTRRK